MAEAVVVGVRVRPFNDREKGLNATVCIDMQGKTTIIKDADGKDKDFTFDESFWSHDGFKDNGQGYMEAEAGSRYADQRYVLDTFGKRVLDNAWDGFHCCLFAYGQTGAGKSYSMVGYGANKGIVPISCEEIFKRIDAETDPNRRYEVTVSMVEIYNETVQDLLIDPDTRPKKGLEIRESKLLGIYIDGVIKRPVKDYAAIEATIEEATGNRTVGSTLMNATSSRAHTVQTIEFKQVEKTAGTERVKISMINLVDLAGSEKAGQTGATGDRLKEGAMINKSLSALGNVIEKLAEKSLGKAKGNVIVPYRDSKLTRLLQNALGGSSKTIMICALSPASSNYEETLSTLRYADRAKKIKNSAVINENPLDKLLRELKEENSKLKDMMAKMQSGDESMDAKVLSEVTAKQQEIEDAQREIAEMSKPFEQRLSEDLVRRRQTVKRPVLTVHDGVPMLVNLNSDPQLTGRTKYHLLKDQVTKIGSHRRRNRYDSIAEDGGDDTSDSDEEEEEEIPDVLLMHSTIIYNHASILNEDNKCYLKTQAESSPVTFVCGKSIALLLGQKDCGAKLLEPIRRGEQPQADDPEIQDEVTLTDQMLEESKGVLLQHGDRVVFGDCYFFFAAPDAPVGPDIMIASKQVDYAKAYKELTANDHGSPWGETPSQIASVVNKMKVFTPILKILEEARHEHKELEEEKAKRTKLQQRISILQHEHEGSGATPSANAELIEARESKARLEKELEELRAEKEGLMSKLKDTGDRSSSTSESDAERKAKLEKEVSKLKAELSQTKLKAQQEQDVKRRLEQELASTKQKLDQALKSLENVQKSGSEVEPHAVTFDQALDALDIMERTLRELEMK